MKCEILTTLVRNTVKFVASVSTRSHVRVFGPVEVQPEEAFGTKTLKPDTESAVARIERVTRACILGNVALAG